MTQRLVWAFILFCACLGPIAAQDSDEAYQRVLKMIQDARQKGDTSFTLREQSVLPAEIGTLTSVTSLELRSLDVDHLPAEIGQLTQLESLLIWDMPLTELPAEIGNLTHLKSLTIGQADITGSAC